VRPTDNVTLARMPDIQAQPKGRIVTSLRPDGRGSKRVSGCCPGSDDDAGQFPGLLITGHALVMDGGPMAQ
jgi:hypothetical protein